MTIYDNLSKPFKLRKHKGEFGLEIETEATENYESPAFSFWEVHNDGSLRGPAPREYVLSQPLNYAKDLPEALKEFKEKTQKVKFVQDSITTSVHVHINMLNEKWLTLGNFLTTYSLVENLLMRYSGEDRKGNMFCLPICDAEENYKNMMNILRRAEARQYGAIQLDRESTKYSALNMGALATLGSLEQRSFRGVTDTDVIYEWVSILNCILVYARQDHTPVDFITNWKNKGPEVLTDIFGNKRELLRIPDEDKLLEKNFWYSVNIANSVKKWKELDIAPQPKKLMTKDLDKISLNAYGVRFEQLTEPQKRDVMNSLKYKKEEIDQQEEDQAFREARTLEEEEWMNRGRLGDLIRQRTTTGHRVTIGGNDTVTFDPQPMITDEFDIPPEDDDI